MNTSNFPVHLPIFHQLTPPGVEELASLAECRQLAAGEVLFRQGERSDALYIITAGSLSGCFRHPNGAESRVAELKAGDCVGETGQFTCQPRLTTVAAASESEVLRLPAAAFERLAQGFPELAAEIAKQLVAQYQRVQISSIMAGLFGTVSDETLGELLEKTTWLRLNNGQVLFRQGDSGNALYVVVQGRLRFSVEEKSGQTRVLGEVGTGESIGEFALLAENGSAESRRSATVYATRLTDVIEISRPLFESLICQYPQAVLNLTRRIVQRQRLIDQSMLVGSSALVVCAIPARAGLSLGEFSRQVEAGFGSLGCTLLLDPAAFEERYGKPGAARTPLDHPTSLLINAWLDEQECQQQYVIYDASPNVIDSGRLSAWAQRCIEDADLVLLVAEGGGTAAVGDVEKLLKAAQLRARVELALVYPAERAVPAHTAAWLDAERGGVAPVQAHYHARLGNAEDFRRMARRISGQAVGLALSGGGARGWAHVGAMRALEEARIEIDWIGGASMGSIIAAGFALGWDAGQMGSLAANFSNPKKLLDYTFPYASITATQRITNLLRQIYGEVDIEDTWRPFFCVSANLTRGEEQIHLTGKLWKAVRASMAFPAVFAPVLDEGCILIDGGAANNLPVDRMRELCPGGKVIGVNLMTNPPVSGSYAFGPALSGWQALLSRFRLYPKKVKAPNLLDIVNGIIYSNNRYRLNETQDRADLIINVPVEAYGLLEFEKYAEIMELGYQMAREQLQGFTVFSEAGKR